MKASSKFETASSPEDAEKLGGSESESKNKYDLEERTLEFASRVRAFVKLLPKTIVNIEDGGTALF
jgi:hypothetical protein